MPFAERFKHKAVVRKDNAGLIKYGGPIVRSTVTMA